MGEIYCLYSSDDGVPQYVGATEGSADKSWKRHITEALDLAPGSLYDWMRETAQGGNYVGVHVLQSSVDAADLNFYESYWVSQFPGLFNTPGIRKPSSALTDTASSVIAAIKSKLAAQHLEDERS
jgi:hypothetical protein